VVDLATPAALVEDVLLADLPVERALLGAREPAVRARPGLLEVLDRRLRTVLVVPIADARPAGLGRPSSSCP
jgi:hypothetical protein